MKIKLRFSQIEMILASEFINRSYIAEKMYPGIKSSSANGKLSNKLNRNGRFKFTEDEEERLIRLVSKEFSKLLR